MVPEHICVFTPSLYELKYSVATEIGVLNSQLFTNNDFHFLIIVESATFRVLLQQTSKLGSKGQSEECGVDDAAVPTETTALIPDRRALCSVVLLGHTSRQISRPLPANRVTQQSQRFAVRVRIDSCSPRHEFNVDDSLCIPEYRCHNFSSRLTCFEFFWLSERLGVPTAFHLVLFGE
jgi:hypothetical protein